MFGQSDLIIRTLSKQPKIFYEEFRNWANEPAENMSVDNMEPADFDRCLYHWLWSTDDKYLMPLDEDVFEQIIRAPNEAQSKLSTANSIQSLSDCGAIKLATLPEPGIRFIVMITEGGLDRLGALAKREFATEVVETVLDVDGISCAEIYEGEQRIWLLIDARVEFENYDAIKELNRRIHDMRITAMGCRATTSLCCNNQTGIMEVERLFISKTGAKERLTDEQLLQALKEPEGTGVEVKGSLRLDMRELLSTGAEKKSNGVQDSILKSIAGFLNGSGGLLIVGALEEPRLSGLDVSQLPEIGEYRLCGVDQDFLRDGFDKAQRIFNRPSSATLGFLFRTTNTHS